MSLNHLQEVSQKQAVFSRLRELRKQGKLTLGQLVALQRMAALGSRTKRSYAALSRWCQVSRSTITRTLNIAERLGIITRHSQRRKYWDGQRVRVVNDTIIVIFQAISSQVQNKPESGSLIYLEKLLVPNEPLDAGLEAALNKLKQSMQKSGRWCPS